MKEPDDGFQMLDTLSAHIDACFEEYGAARDHRAWGQTHTQRDLMKRFKSVDAVNAFGPELKASVARLRDEYGLEPTRTMVPYGVPRKRGKASAIAIYTAAGLLLFPGRRSAVVTASEFAIRQLHQNTLAVLRAVMHRFPGLVTLTNNRGEIALRFADGDVRRARFFSCVRPPRNVEPPHMTIATHSGWVAATADPDMAIAVITSRCG